MTWWTRHILLNKIKHRTQSCLAKSGNTCLTLFNIIQTCAKSIKIHSIFHWTAEAQISIFHSRVQIFNLWKTRWGAQTIYQGLRNTSVSSVSRHGFEKAEWRRDSRPCSEVGCLRIEIATLPREGHNPLKRQAKRRGRTSACALRQNSWPVVPFWSAPAERRGDQPRFAIDGKALWVIWEKLDGTPRTWFQPWEHIGNLRILIRYSRETT